MTTTTTTTPAPSTATVGIATQSRPFAAKRDGRCPLFGTRITAGYTTVRTVDLVVYATGARYTATVDARNYEAMEFTSGHAPEAAHGCQFSSRFTRAGTEAATTAILAALDAGLHVAIVTPKSMGFRDHRYQTWHMDASSVLRSGVSRKTRAQFVAQVAASAHAYRITR